MGKGPGLSVTLFQHWREERRWCFIDHSLESGAMPKVAACHSRLQCYGQGSKRVG